MTKKYKPLISLMILNYFRYLLLFFLVQFFICCQGQNNETYWKAEYVNKIDRKPIHAGLRLAYMEMIRDMNIHLSVKNDSLVFVYPDERKVSLKDLKSITNVVNVDDKKYLDNTYDVELADSLKIKFYFGDKKNDDNSYELVFSPVNKKQFDIDSQKLILDRKKIIEMLKTTDYSAINLSTPKPLYFDNDLNISILNPIQFAEMISVDNDGLQLGKNHYSVSKKDSGNLNFIEYYIKKSNKLKFHAAKFGHISFNDLKLIWNETSGKTDAIILNQKNLSKEDIKQIFQVINSQIKNINIMEANYLDISWSDNNKIVKLVVNDEAENTESSENFMATIKNSNNSTTIEKNLESYLSLCKGSDVTITIVSAELTKFIKSDDFKQRIGGQPFVVEYNH